MYGPLTKKAIGFCTNTVEHLFLGALKVDVTVKFDYWTTSKSMVTHRPVCQKKTLQKNRPSNATVTHV
jgi:hypothetical protein